MTSYDILCYIMLKDFPKCQQHTCMQMELGTAIGVDIESSVRVK